MENSNILKNILNNTPHGIIITSHYLKQHKVSSKLAWWYVHANWLQHLDDRAYKRVNDKISWSGLLYTLQTIHKVDIHLSGKSAIDVSGKSHYLYLSNNKTIFVSIGKTAKIPTWFRRAICIPEKFSIDRSVLLDEKDTTKYLISANFDGLIVYYSCAELAILEILAKCKTEHDYEEANQLIESFPYLRSLVVQELLERSSSILATRLYLHFAKRHNHKWYKKLDISKFNLGVGKRRIAAGKFYDKDLQLYVPLQEGY